MAAFQAKAGPFALDGRLPAAHCKISAVDHDWIRAMTGCSVWCRNRKNWPEKMLTLSGPPQQLEAGKWLAEELLLFRAGLGPCPYWG